VTGGGRSGSGGGRGGLPGGGCGVGPWAEPAAMRQISEIGAPAVVLPIAIASRLRPFRAADLAQLCCRRLRCFGRSGGAGLDRVTRFFSHVPNIGGSRAVSTSYQALKRWVFGV
jgi:hypothetical protein